MTILTNKKAFFDYSIEDKYEAGICLEGWEVKSIRAGKVSIKESYIRIKNGEVFLTGCTITPLIQASTHDLHLNVRDRKLLLHSAQIKRLIGKVEQSGYTLVITDLHYSKGKIKANIALAKGKNKADKRNSLKEKDAERSIARQFAKG